ncbi:MAG: DUF2066 domain-containing protein [Spongiibacteraceae bacterium]|nr:DUF2066 domain-containing protein [Spongiibacteraceae bacterium]
MLNIDTNLRVILIALFAIFIPFTHNVLAEQVNGLYGTRIPVLSQSERSLRTASKLGLKDVFIRVSGSESVVNQAQIAAAIDNADTYIKQFRYQRTRNPGDESQQLFVMLEFEREQVDTLLREAGLPLWSSNRPSVLVWVVVEDREGRRFASADSDPELIDAIRTHAARRGLAIKLPLLDLEDNLLVSPDQLWQLSPESTQTIAQRYQSDTVLTGRATQLTNGQWLGSWLYQFNQKQLRFDGDAGDIENYIGASLNQVADLLAADYAIVRANTADSGVLMRLSGISDFNDYAQAINYLENVAAIRYANVIDIQGDEIIVRLKADGLLQQLQQSFALDKRLQPSAVQAYQGEYTIALDYQWP